MLITYKATQTDNSIFDMFDGMRKKIPHKNYKTDRKIEKMLDSRKCTQLTQVTVPSQKIGKNTDRNGKLDIVVAVEILVLSRDLPNNFFRLHRLRKLGLSDNEIQRISPEIQVRIQ